MFLNSNIDMLRIEYQITDPDLMILFEMTLAAGRLTSAVTGGALALTTVVMMLFYIKHHIDTHKSELGILKAMGYSGLKIAINFWVFGLSVLAGAGAGFGGAFALMPAFYREMRTGTPLPDTPLHFNPILVVGLVILPAVAFALLGVLYSYFKLKRPALELIKGKSKAVFRKSKPFTKVDRNIPFLHELKRSTVRSRFSLVFFIWLASFTFATCVVMSFSIADVGAGEMMAAVMAIIGIVLAVTILFISVTTVIKGNSKTIAMLQVFGYSERECAKAMLSGYRPIALVGFAIGTAYQHGLMLMMIHLFFDEVAPDYSFNVQAFVIAFVSFSLLYEIFMMVYSKKIKRIPLKQVMQED
jgi:putative ABC transport system permease protein